MQVPHAVLNVDLGAIRDNYRCLVDQAGGAEVAPAIKADAYGLGAVPVAAALWQAGARSFFVAQSHEAAFIRAELPEARIFVLNGPMPNEVDALRAGRVVPVLNSLEQITLWAEASAPGERLPAALHLDSGMSRLGLPPYEIDQLAGEPEVLERLEIVLVTSHLASADEPESPMTERQYETFMAMADRLPAVAAKAPRTLANSSGIGHPGAHNLDMVRPGFALYGGNPIPGRPNPMRPVATVEAPVLQIRQVPAGTPVGYNATFVTKMPSRLATLAIGYADGYDRSLSNRGRVVIAGLSAPIVGRVSMDLTIVDVGHIPEHLCKPGVMATVLGSEPCLEEVAATADTIGYEILARLGQRLHRRHLGA